MKPELFVQLLMTVYAEPTMCRNLIATWCYWNCFVQANNDDFLRLSNQRRMMNQKIFQANLTESQIKFAQTRGAMKVKRKKGRFIN